MRIARESKGNQKKAAAALNSYVDHYISMNIRERRVNLQLLTKKALGKFIKK
ncbi:MAG: hypothetical protein Satyrvirus14_1 [Satyrvirus sp.]|uniref:Uncharacterized protein n=1 Tax=Satyrvirus sp. TaxID=2487771 RepID=A0A3G5ADT3_9VIRU|nr:MAG: hypothetical protein Satyrvirus14_1 [Satyrvirus sp.]